MGDKPSLLLLLVLLCSSPSILGKTYEDPIASLLPQLQGLVDALPSLVTMLVTGQDFEFDEFGEAADEWFTKAIPELRSLIETFSTLIRMALKVIIIIIIIIIIIVIIIIIIVIIVIIIIIIVIIVIIIIIEGGGQDRRHHGQG